METIAEIIRAPGRKSEIEYSPLAYVDPTGR
jgi:hypothetical protein